MPKIRSFVNFALYQTGWFALVLGAANGYVWQGTLLGLVAIGGCWSLSAERKRDGSALLLTAVVGASIETGFQLMGVFTIVAGDVWHPFPAPWLLLVWASFGLTLHESMHWLFRNPVFAALGGTIFGPIAYAGGARMGAIRFEPDLADHALISVVWAVAFALLSFFVSQTTTPVTAAVPGTQCC